MRQAGGHVFALVAFGNEQVPRGGQNGSGDGLSFPVLAFSVSFELEITGLFEVLDLPTEQQLDRMVSVTQEAVKAVTGK